MQHKWPYWLLVNKHSSVFRLKQMLGSMDYSKNSLDGLLRCRISFQTHHKLKSFNTSPVHILNSKDPQIDVDYTLQWPHKEHNGVSIHQCLDCLLNQFSDADQRKYQSSTSLAFERRIHQSSVNSPHKWPVKRDMFPFDDIIMYPSDAEMSDRCLTDVDLRVFAIWATSISLPESFAITVKSLI